MSTKLVLFSQDIELIRELKEWAEPRRCELVVRNENEVLLPHSHQFNSADRFSINSGNHKSIESMPEIEKKAIIDALRACEGNMSLAARSLNIGRATLYRKVKLYHIDTEPVRRKKVS